MTTVSPLNISAAIRSTRQLKTPLSLVRCAHYSAVSCPSSTVRPVSRTSGSRISVASIRPKFFHSTPSNFFAAAPKMGKPKALLLGEIDQ